jgi:Alkylmercury lyase
MDQALREDVRLAVYDSFRRRGRAPSVDEIAAAVASGPERARELLAELHASRDLVLDRDDEDKIVMAHPFSSVPLGFSVMGRGTLWWGGCAWDSFAIPHLVPEEPSVLVATTCPACGAALAWVVGRRHAPEGPEVAHFLTPVARIWDDVVHTCAHQRLFCSTDCVENWLARTGRPRGYVMDLTTLWRLAEGWYGGRLDRGYRRREPTEAAEYFRSVGLRGAFWGLDDRV